MASALKRKRGPVEVTETPKRAKSVKDSQESLSMSKASQSGWEAAFNPPKEMKELMQKNGINGDGTNNTQRGTSPNVLAFDNLAEHAKEEERKKKAAMLEEKKYLRSFSTPKPDVWTISDPIGGRMINVDPVFTQDEQYEAFLEVYVCVECG
jgi:NET1-associated nuclear protein 1 (U3 small nucleolar RNA-associated protein 17)